MSALGHLDNSWPPPLHLLESKEITGEELGQDIPDTGGGLGGIRRQGNTANIFPDSP